MQQISQFLLAADSSSIILLQKVDALEKFACACRFQITSLVRNELYRGASASEINEFEKHTFLIDLINHIDRLPRNMSFADASVIELHRRCTSQAVLSDDRAILNYCKQNELEHFCCLSLLSPLVQRNIISAHDARTLFPRLEKAGRYSQKVIEIALGMLVLSINEST